MDIQIYSPSVIASQLSALAYTHKANNLQDHTQSFRVRKMLSGCRKLNPCPMDTRKPTDKTMLSTLCSALPALLSNKYQCALYRAAFSLAFYAFLRVGEFTISGKQHMNILQFENRYCPPDSHITCPKIEITFRNYKHSDGTCHKISIQSVQLAEAL